MSGSSKRKKSRRPTKSSFCLRSPPPSQHLKKILENYPEGPQILNEALQNADDAGAYIFRVILDERHHRCDDPALDRHSGPALLLFNDETFTDNDWKSLQNMFESTKKEEPWKIGSFGMGSRSYFHLADVVTVISGERVAYLDPDWTINENGGGSLLFSELCQSAAGNGRETITMEGVASEVSTTESLPQTSRNAAASRNATTSSCSTESCDDSREPLCNLLAPLTGVMGLTVGATQYFAGTLFRLPLRMGKWVSRSSIAPCEYTIERTQQVLRRFQATAAESLLFLQSVAHIEVWRWRESAEQPQREFRCSIKPAKLRDSNGRLLYEGDSRTDCRGVFKRFFQNQQRLGLSLKDILNQGGSGIFPEVHDFFDLFTQNSDSNGSTSNLVVSRCTFLTDIRISPGAPTALPLLRHRPPIIGVALPVTPKHEVVLTPAEINNLFWRHSDKATGPTTGSCPLENVARERNAAGETALAECRRALNYQSSSRAPTAKESLLHPRLANHIPASFCEWILQSYTPPSAISSQPFTEQESPSKTHPVYAFEEEDDCGIGGQLFAFLPLPDVYTGLPVHIHGTFILTDNRRNLWLSKSGLEGDALRWVEWNQRLLLSDVPIIYGQLIRRFATVCLVSAEVIRKLQMGQAPKSVDPNLVTSLSPEAASAALKAITILFYSAWPNAAPVSPALKSILVELARLLKNEPIYLVASLLQTSVTTRSAEMQFVLTVFTPAEIQFLVLTSTESAVIFGKKSHKITPRLLDVAVTQCQLDGHKLVLAPAFVRDLLSLDVTTSASSLPKIPEDTVFVQKPDDRSVAAGSIVPGQLPNDRTVTFVEMIRRYMLPRWMTLSPSDLQCIPNFPHLMLALCKVLGRGADKTIARFRPMCQNLRFVPAPFPGVEYDEDETPPLRSPAQCCDPTLDRYRAARVSQPDGEWRAPDALRVLRAWGLRQNLGWGDVAHEAASQICVIGGCHQQRDQMETCLFPRV